MTPRSESNTQVRAVRATANDALRERKVLMSLQCVGQHAARVLGLFMLLCHTGCSGKISDPNNPGWHLAHPSSPSTDLSTTDKQTMAADPMRSQGTTAVSDAGGMAPTTATPSLPVCDDTQRGRSEEDMRRLTTPEILLSLRAVFGSVMDADSVKALVPTLPAEPTLAADRVFDNRIQDVESLEAVASAVAHRVVSDAAAARSILDCDVQNELMKCRATLLDRLARRLFRRPLRDDERTSYSAFIDAIGGSDGLESAIVRAIVSPHFHQHLELESTADGSGRRRIDGFAAASRVAFALTGALPDESMLRAAEDGKLTTLDELHAHAARLVQTDAGRDRVRNVLTDWLKIAPPDPAPAAAAALHVDAKGLGAETRGEFIRFVDYIVFEQRGTLRDLWTNNTVFPFSERLAALFGVSRSDGPVEGTGAARGLFLRPASLITSATDTSPIIRGATMRRGALCEVFPTPDPALVAAGKAIRDKLAPTEHSGRERAATATDGAVCAGCHARINAMGFVLEGFGPLGEWRTSQAVLDDRGSQIASFPVDSSVADILVDRVGAVPDSRALGTALASTDATAHCLAERLFSSSRLRGSGKADACVLRALVAGAADRPFLDSFIAAIVNEDVFYRAEVTP